MLTLTFSSSFENELSNTYYHNQKVYYSHDNLEVKAKILIFEFF